MNVAKPIRSHATRRRANEPRPPKSAVRLPNTPAGLIAAAVLTGASFWVAGTSAVWAPGIPVLLAALAIAQMGVHLMFFLHITSGAEGTNNILALAFGIFVVGLVVFGSMIIMRDLDDNMTMPMDKMMQMQR